MLYWRDTSGLALQDTDSYGHVEADYVFLAGRRFAIYSPANGINYRFTDTRGSPLDWNRAGCRRHPEPRR